MVGETVNPEAKEYDRFVCPACQSVIDLSSKLPKDEQAK
jgi:hypothetical protein